MIHIKEIEQIILKFAGHHIYTQSQNNSERKKEKGGHHTSDFKLYRKT